MNYDFVLAQRKKSSVANQRLLSAAGLSTTPHVDTAVLHEDTQHRRMMRQTKPFIDDGVRITKHGLEYTAYGGKQGRPKTPNNPFEYSDRYMRTMRCGKPPSLYTRRGEVRGENSGIVNDERQPRPSSAMSRGFGGLELRPVSRVCRPTTAMGGGVTSHAMSPYTFDSSVALCDTLQPFRPLSALAHSRGRSSMAHNPYVPRRVYSTPAPKSGNTRLERLGPSSSNTRLGPSSSPAQTLANIRTQSMLYSGFI